MGRSTAISSRDNVSQAVKIRTYREVSRIPTFEDRFEYLKLGGKVGEASFGFDRYLNQILYRSPEWKRTRAGILIRDEFDGHSCDLAVAGRPIPVKPIVHHINPITLEDIEQRADCVFDPENLITVSHDTHNALHFGDASLLPKLPIERRKGDTSLWNPTRMRS